MTGVSGGWGEKTCVFPLGHWIGLYFFSNLESNPFPTGKSRETAITGGHCQTFWFVDQTRCYWCAQAQVTCCIPHFISNLSKNAAPHDNIGKPLIMQTFGCCVITRTVDGLTKECIPLFTLNAVKTENAILIGGGFSLYTYRETCVSYQCKGEHVTFTPRLCPVLIEREKKKTFFIQWRGKSVLHQIILRCSESVCLLVSRTYDIQTFLCLEFSIDDTEHSQPGNSPALASQTQHGNQRNIISAIPL